MHINLDEIIEKANQIISRSESRDPRNIAESLGIIILERPFKKQLGAYQKISNTHFIFIKQDLNEALYNIVLMHEIAHFLLHQEYLTDNFFILDSDLFGQKNQMEYEANYFAAQVLLPDEEFFEFLKYGYTVDQIVSATGSNKNLVSLKVELLKKQGFQLRSQPYQSKFLNN